VQLNDRVNALLREREAQISQLAIAKRRLQAAAITDALTGLPNRRYAMERLQRELEAARRNKTELAVMMIDIDRFKAVNDGHGHDVGDVVLRETARNLRGSLRSIDVVCRLGGEEFLILCPGTGLQDATGVAERLCCVVRERVVPVPGFERAITVSVGVAALDDACAGVDALIKRADERVYLAKQAGRDRVVAAGPAPAAPAAEAATQARKAG
jgi:diguanylate cyclase (GGDEF)-like protein